MSEAASDSHVSIPSLVGPVPDKGHYKYRLCIFISQFFMSLLTMCFCFYQLITLVSCESQLLYTGIITMIIGVYLPTPKLKTK